MLNIYFGDIPESLKDKYIFDTKTYFNNTYMDEWIIEQTSKEIIKAIDKSNVIDSRAIKSPVFGIIDPKKLSTGTKTVLLIMHDDSKIFNASMCGDNCAKWILEFAKHNDATISLHHLMDFGKGEFKINILNVNKIVTNMGDLVWEAGEFI